MFTLIIIFICMCVCYLFIYLLNYFLEPSCPLSDYHPPGGSSPTHSKSRRVVQSLGSDLTTLPTLAKRLDMQMEDLQVRGGTMGGVCVLY